MLRERVQQLHDRYRNLHAPVVFREEIVKDLRRILDAEEREDARTNDQSGVGGSATG